MHEYMCINYLKVHLIPQPHPLMHILPLKLLRLKLVNQLSNVDCSLSLLQAAHAIVNGVAVVVGTPPSLLRLFENKLLDLKALRHVVRPRVYTVRIRNSYV